jgi:small subunit ribosomal protein S6
MTVCKEQVMPLYENVFIARQDIPAQEVEALSETFSTIITDNGGEVKRREYWGLRNLAYRIKKKRKGHYTLFHIDAPAAAVHEMERNMRISEDVLRYLTLKIDEIEDAPTIIMQSRSAREERGRRDGGSGRRHEGDRGRRDGKEPDKAEDKEPGKADAKKPDEAEGKEPDKADAKKPDEAEGKEPDQADAKEPDEAEGKEPDQAAAKEPDEAEGKEPDQADAKEPDEAEGKEPDQAAVSAETPATESGPEPTPDSAEPDAPKAPKTTEGD